MTDDQPTREPDQPEPAVPADGGPPSGESAVTAGAEGHPALARAAEANELADLRDRHLRLAAEFDNFKRRSQKERAEVGDRAQAQLAARLLDALDDLARALDSDPATTPAEALRSALEAIARKLGKELEGAGLERLDATGQRFDPALHEAVSIVPAAGGQEPNIVSATFQAGYRFRGHLVRPARVQVTAEQA